MTNPADSAAAISEIHGVEAYAAAPKALKALKAQVRRHKQRHKVVADAAKDRIGLRESTTVLI